MTAPTVYPDVIVTEMPEPMSPFPPQHQERPGLESEMSPAPRYQAELYREGGKLAGRVALITGGDSGIGRAVALLFAREGADVAIVYTPAEEGDAADTIGEIEAAGGRGLAIPGDVRDSAFCNEAVARTVAELGGLHVLVNNAAYQHHCASIEDVDDEQLRRTFETNIFGYFYMARAAVPHMGR